MRMPEGSGSACEEDVVSHAVLGVKNGVHEDLA